MNRAMIFCCTAVKSSFSTYVWCKVDSCFCEAVYVYHRLITHFHSIFVASWLLSLCIYLLYCSWSNRDKLVFRDTFSHSPILDNLALQCPKVSFQDKSNDLQLFFRVKNKIIYCLVFNVENMVQYFLKILTAI